MPRRSGRLIILLKVSVGMVRSPSFTTSVGLGSEDDSLRTLLRGAGSFMALVVFPKAGKVSPKMALAGGGTLG